MTKLIFAFREALFSLGRFVTWLSIATITSAIFILGLFLLVSHNLHNAFQHMKSQVSAEIFLKEDIGPENQLSEIFKSKEWVSSVEYISKQEAMERLEKMTDGDLLAGLSENPLPPSIVIHFAGDQDLADLADNVDRILAPRSDVLSRFVPTNTMQKLDKAYKLFVGLAALWTVIIVFGSIFVVTNTIRLAMVSKEESITIMDLVGADRGFIRIPFILEGLLHGMISGLISALLILIIGQTLTFFPTLEPLPLFYIFFLFICGILFGITGSRIAIHRYTK